MTAGVLLLLVCLLLTACIHYRHSARQDPKDEKQRQSAVSKEGGFQLIFRDRYLLSIAALVVLLNIVNTSGEFLLSKLVVARSRAAFPGAAMTAARARFIGEFYGSFFAWVNLAGPGAPELLRVADLQSDRSRRRTIRRTRDCVDRLLVILVAPVLGSSAY